jgi:hypothetical protein
MFVNRPMWVQSFLFCKVAVIHNPLERLYGEGNLARNLLSHTRTFSKSVHNKINTNEYKNDFPVCNLRY